MTSTAAIMYSTLQSNSFFLRPYLINFDILYHLYFLLQSSQEISSLLLPTEEEMRLPYVFTITFINDESDLIIDKLTTNLRTGAVIRLREEAAEENIPHSPIFVPNNDPSTTPHGASSTHIPSNPMSSNGSGAIRFEEIIKYLDERDSKLIAEMEEEHKKLFLAEKALLHEKLDFIISILNGMRTTNVGHVSPTMNAIVNRESDGINLLSIIF